MPESSLPLLSPDWPAPARVVAATTLRQGGSSLPPYDSFNQGLHVGDEPAAVADNRARLQAACPGLSALQWLDQVHGTAVVRAGEQLLPAADGCYSREPGQGCAVMTADCLPVLFCNRDGSEVAAAHAGWRGLQAGVLESTVAAMASAPHTLLAWLGPAIGPAQFEVGAEVREAFVASDSRAETAFVAVRPGHYLADLYRLARQRLQACGVDQVYGGGFCTFDDRQRFYSYRRDGVTGRMASLIYIAE